MKFSEFGQLNPTILTAIEKMGFTDATKVQERALPRALEGKDILVSSMTGSGKTAAYLVPILNKILNNPTSNKGVRYLIMTPTRELAEQVEKTILQLGKDIKGLRVCCIIGGVPYFKQIRALEKPLDIAIGTPGRLCDHLNSGRLNLSNLECLVLDEVDRMLEMGFSEDLDKIIDSAPEKKQTMMFSATIPKEVERLAKNVSKNLERLEVDQMVAAPDIEQKLLVVDSLSHKKELLSAIFKDGEIKCAIVFTATKKASEEIAYELNDADITADALNGDMRQGQRKRIVERFKRNKFRVLVATDLAGRGLDIDSITHVINFDTPRNVEDYIHRIGRTGRAGRSGISMTFASRGDQDYIRDIERTLKTKMGIQVMEGLEPQTSFSERKKSSNGSNSNRSFGSRSRSGSGRPNSQPSNGGGRPGNDSRKRSFGNTSNGSRGANSASRDRKPFSNDRNAERPATERRAERPSSDRRNDRPMERRAERPTDRRTDRPATERRNDRPAPNRGAEKSFTKKSSFAKGRSNNRGSGREGVASSY